MKQTLTQSRMLEIWRRKRMVEPLRLDCTVSRTDGPDVDAILTEEMRSWYLDLLDHGPLSALAPVDVTQTCKLDPMSDGRVMISGPEGCRRILSIWFSAWDYPIQVSDEALRTDFNPYQQRPGAFRLAPDRVAAVGARGSLREVIAAVDISPSVYIFDDSALKNLC